MNPQNGQSNMTIQTDYNMISSEDLILNCTSGEASWTFTASLSPSTPKERRWEMASHRPSSSMIAKEQQLLAETLQRHREAVCFWETMLEMELFSYLLLGTAIQLIRHYCLMGMDRQNKDMMMSLIFIVRVASLVLSAIHSTIDEYEQN